MSESMGTVTAPTNEIVLAGDVAFDGRLRIVSGVGEQIPVTFQEYLKWIQPHLAPERKTVTDNDPDGALVPLPVRKTPERVVPPLPAFTYAVMLK